MYRYPAFRSALAGRNRRPRQRSASERDVPGHAGGCARQATRPPATHPRRPTPGDPPSATDPRPADPRPAAVCTGWALWPPAIRQCPTLCHGMRRLAAERLFRSPDARRSR